MKRIFVFGGSFDPIHIGHLILAQSCGEALNCRVVFLPTGNPPHKSNITSARHRLNMLKLAVSGNNKFDISTYEIEKKEKSYTYKTLEHLSKFYGKEIFFFVGGDSLQDIHKWKKPEMILEQSTLVYAKRPGYIVEVKNHFDKYGLNYNKVHEINTPMIDISSTDIRNKVKQGLTIKYLVPLAVERYIKTHNLYKG